MKPTTILLCDSLLTLSGCFYTNPTTPISPPIKRELKNVGTWSNLPASGSVSIGDKLFWIHRYISGAREIPAVSPPPPLLPFPENCEWYQTYSYNEPGGKAYQVYTCSLYYEGHIGVVLDTEDRLATQEPYIQVEGAKDGRRWKARSGEVFFRVPNTLYEAWGIRFGGRRGSDFVFEVLDSRNPSTSDITHSLLISEADFYSGFTVRGVVVTGVEESGQGVISFRLRDARVSQ